MIIAGDLGLLEVKEAERLSEKAAEIRAMLSELIKSLENDISEDSRYVAWNDR